MAPTKPLVTQQIRACHDIMGINQSDTAEMQGNVHPLQREKLWGKNTLSIYPMDIYFIILLASKRVFFCTPQCIQNDLDEGRCQYVPQLPHAY